MGAHINQPRRANGETERRVMDAIRRIVQALRLFDRAAEKHAGLSGAQLFVLQKLRDGRAISLNELAQRTHTHQSSVSVVVGKLVRRKLVARERSPKDGRRLEVSIEPAGRLILRSSPVAAQDRLIAAIQRLPLNRRQELAAILEHLVAETGVDRQTPVFFFEDGSSSHARN